MRLEYWMRHSAVFTVAAIRTGQLALSVMITFTVLVAPVCAQSEFKDFDTLMQDAASRNRSKAQGVSGATTSRSRPASDLSPFTNPFQPATRSGSEVAAPRNFGQSLEIPASRNDDTSQSRQFEDFRSGSDRTPGANDQFPVYPDRKPARPPIDDGRSLQPNSSLRFPELSNERRDLTDGVLHQRDFNSPMQFISQSTETEPQFDWAEQTTSIADLRFPKMTSFQHGDAFMTPEEESAYMQLLDTITQQRRMLVRQTSDEAVQRSLETQGLQVDGDTTVSVKGSAVWQEAFYQFANARRLAWDNGHLRDRDVADKIGGLPDPFSPAMKKESKTADADLPYQLMDDIRQFPEDFVGRPIVLYGRFTASSIVRLGADDPSRTRYEERTSSGRPLDTARREVRLMRGSLTALNSAEQLAMVDTKELLTPQLGSLQPTEWPNEAGSILVMVKGWVVKKWDSRPLVFCESMRQISSIPHFQLVRQNSIDRSRIRDEEKWLYYETLAQMGLTRNSIQQNVARSVLNQRIDELMLQVKEKADTGAKQLAEKLKASSITEDQYRQQKVSLQRSLNQRVSRYRHYRKNPDEFQTFVDVFQNPDFWHGHLVTLHGHVRHVVSYPADETLFGDENGPRMLHELWLFTDDSQHNPAVIVTPQLPTDFPTDAEVVDRVSVTGCFFKRYIYGSQDADRIAPLLLAGRIQWSPTVDQVQALVADGHLDAKSSRAVKAAKLGEGMSDAAMMLVCFLILLTFMILWGRAQREERDRVRLRKRVNDVPEFDSSEVPDMSLSLTDFDQDYRSQSSDMYRRGELSGYHRVP